MQKYLNNVQDTFGNAIGSVTVTVRTNPGGSLATLFSDNAGTPKSNPFTNDADGEFFFYSVDGRYDIELTGPITETKSDIRLLDILTTGTTLRINTDIATATPPTVEGVNGEYEIWDLTNNDKLAHFGFSGTNDLNFINKMRGGWLKLWAQDSAGVGHQLFAGDPDAESRIYFDGVQRIWTATNGMVVYGSLANDPGVSGVQDALIRLRSQQGNSAGFIGYEGNTSFIIRNAVHGGIIALTAEDAGGVNRTMFQGDPDAVAGIYHAGGLRASTNTTGRLLVHSDGNTDTEQRGVNLTHLNGLVRGSFGYLTDGVVTLRNLVHGNGFLFTAEDAGGTTRTILEADPDAETVLIADTSIRLKSGTTSGNSALLGVINAETRLFYNGNESLSTALRTAANQISGAEVLDAGGVLTPVGLGVSKEVALSGTGTQTYFSQGRCGATIYWTGGSATNMDTYANTGSSQTNIPNGAWWVVQNNGAGALTIRGGTSVTIRYWSGAGAAPADVDVVIPRGSNVLIRKVADTVYDVSHN